MWGCGEEAFRTPVYIRVEIQQDYITTNVIRGRIRRHHEI
jgi:hypothetical protein